MTRQQMLRAAALGAVVALSACTPDAADPLLPAADASLDEVETTLTVISELTATGTWEREELYSWMVSKTASASELPITLGETKTIDYNLAVTRNVSIVDEFNSRGEVCLTTYSGVPQNLNITGKIQYYDAEANNGEGVWAEIPQATNEVDMLAPRNAGTDEYGGQITCYRYKASMGSTPHQTVDWLGYQYMALVFISNLQWGEEYLQARKQFFLPTEPTIQRTNATASLGDQLFCPAGFTCGALPLELQSAVQLNGSREWNFSVDVTNQGATCAAHRVRNLATLTVDGPGAGGQRAADTWMEYSCDGVDASIEACNAGFWREPANFPKWVNHSPNDLVETVFTAASLYYQGNTPLSEKSLVRALSFGGEDQLLGAARDLLRESTARLLNVQHLGGDVAGLKTAVNAALSSQDRIAILDLTGQLRGQNFAGTCRLQ